MKKILALCGLLFVGVTCSMDKVSFETIEINGIIYVVSNVRIDSTTNETIKVVDRFGWMDLSLKDQVKRARALGEHYNAYNSGPDYLNVGSVLYLAKMESKK